jgi:hypothetical protein
MSSQPFQLHSEQNKIKKTPSIIPQKTSGSTQKNRSLDQFSSKENYILKSSKAYLSKHLNPENNLYISQKVNWSHRNTPLTRVSMRSSKNTLKLLKNMKTDKIQELSSPDLFHPRNISPRKTAKVTLRHDLIHNSPRNSLNGRSSQVVILPSVSPIISRKSRASRTSVKKMILEPQEIEERRVMTFEKSPSEEIKTKERNTGTITKSKVMPVEFYDQILMNASILSEKEKTEMSPKKSLFNIKDVIRKSMELINDGHKEPDSARNSRHQSLQKSYFSRNTSQQRNIPPTSNLVNNIKEFEMEQKSRLNKLNSSKNILPGHVIPTMDMFQSMEKTSRQRSMSHCNSKTSVISRGSSSFKIVKRELNVSAQMSRKKKTRLSHDLRAFKINVELVENEEDEVEKESNHFGKNESVLINRENFPKLFNLQEEMKNSNNEQVLETHERNIFNKESLDKDDYADSPFKHRNKKSKAIFDSLSKDLKDILNKRRTKKLQHLRSKSNSIKKVSVDQDISEFEQKGIMTFRKRESKKSLYHERDVGNLPPKEFIIQNDNSEEINKEVFDHMHISYINSTMFNSKVNNIPKKSLDRKERSKRIDQIEADLNKIRQKKPIHFKRHYQQNNFYRQVIGTTPPKMKPRKSRSPLHLQPSPKFNPQPRIKKNYSQKYINTFKKNMKNKNKEHGETEKIKGYCSIKFAAMELKNQQKKLENILETCQNTFKKLDWNINNLEELKHRKTKKQEMKIKQNSYRQNHFKPGNGYKKYSTLSRRNGSNKNLKKKFGGRSSRNCINELYKDFCKTLDFGKNNKQQKGNEKSNKIMRLNLIKKKLNRL